MFQEQMCAYWKTLFIKEEATNKLINTQVMVFFSRTNTVHSGRWKHLLIHYLCQIITPNINYNIIAEAKNCDAVILVFFLLHLCYNNGTVKKKVI